MNKIVGIVFLFLTLMNPAWSQSYNFEHITTTEGLSQNDVNDIFQDKSGFLWIATNDGLNRYDGYNFKTYTLNPYSSDGISSNLAFCMTEDADGNIWLGTSDQGVCKFDVNTEKFEVYKNTDDNPNLLGDNRISCILASRDGSIWIGSSYGINILTVDGDEVKTEFLNMQNTPGLLSDVVNVIVEDIYGRKWIGTKGGLYVYDVNKEKEKLSVISNWAYVNDIYIADNEVYAAFTSGVTRVRFNWETLDNIKLENVGSENSRSIMLNNFGDLYVGTNYGLFVYERNPMNKNGFKPAVRYTEGWEKYNLTKNIITSIYKDKSGIIWIGTNGGGLNKYNPKHKKFRHFNKTRVEGSLSYNKIRAIYEDREKNIWIGTEGGGVNFLPSSENKNFASGFKYFDVNANNWQNHVYSFVDLNSQGEVNMLVGSGYPSVSNLIGVDDEELKLLDKGALTEVVNSPFCLVNDRNGNIWLGTYGIMGLYKYSKDENGAKVQRFFADGKNGLVSNTIRSLLEDSYGNIWIGTDKGLNLLTVEQQNSVNPKFILFEQDVNNPHALSHNYILPLFQASDKTIWVGTMGGGLNKLIYHPNPDSIKFEGITVKEGLANNVIKGILEDEYGFLWISSNKGLTCYDSKDQIFIHYDVSDGLQDNEFGELACCKLSDGEMLFGGVNGFNAFYPKDIIRDMSSPEIALTDFHILNELVKPGDKVNGRVVLENVINHTEEIKLKYSENSFAVYFSSLHFAAPQKNIYKYMLEGFDTDWIRKDASDRIAKYTNLNPGTYTFKILASNNDGIWTNQPKVLKVIVTPPWYLTTMAWVVYVLLFVASLWFFQRFSLIRIKQKNELIMEHFEKEKIQELSQMKLRFFTNISHEFRTPLTLIIGPLEKLIQQGGYNRKTEESFSIMHRNASILLRLINQLIDFRKFEQGKMKLHVSESNIVPFLQNVYSSFAELAKDKNIDYKFSAARNQIPVWFDDDKLERIMYNLLSNAFKFTPEKGEIEVHIGEDDFEIIIEVIDNGIGIPAEFQSHIFERFYQARQIENRKVGSTGIGLSFIKGLVELHKGEISFVSEESKGTTFFVKLKKGNAHLAEDEMTEHEQGEVQRADFVREAIVETDQGEDEVDDLNKPKVLLVEDNFELRKFLKDSLKDKYKIILADNGQEGIEKTKEMMPDIIVSDIMMPVMSGFELCETIKSDETISHIPIILLTAKSTSENRIKGYKLGADAYISKPFKIDVLEVRIQNLIESRNKLKDKLRTTISVEPSEVTTTSMDEKFLKRMLRTIEENIADPEFKVSQLASECGMSQINLNKKIKGLTGQTPKVFIRSIRLKRAAQLLSTQKYSISEIAFEVGFLDIKYFRSCFKEEFNMLPSQYIKQKTDSE